MLAPLPPDRRLSIDEFFELYAGCEEKYELVRGVPRMMASASRAHNTIVANLVRHLGNALDGRPCRAMPSGMGLETDEDTCRLPDVGIYCDPRDLLSQGDPNRMRHPKVLFEVLSPSTERGDKGHKLLEYQRLASLDAVVILDPRRKMITHFERLGPDRWQSVSLLPGAALVLRDPAITLTAEQIFAGV